MTNSSERKYKWTEHILFPPTRSKLDQLETTLSGKTVLITGASFGIGNELAKHISFKNTHLILVSRTQEKLEELRKLIESKGGSAAIYAADLRVESEINTFIQYLYQLEKGIDLFVNNAGKSIHRSLSDSLDRPHDFQRTIDINYMAPVKLSLALVPMLEKNNGQIINVSAINVLLPPMPKWSAYQSSKTAFDQWIRSNSPELKSKGITASTLYLPLVKTRMMAPTKAYDNMPAMKPQHVVHIIGKLILNKRRRFKPWWLGPIEVVSILFKKPITYFTHLKFKSDVSTD